MSNQVQEIVTRCVIRYLNGDRKEFERLKKIVEDLYEKERHLYVPVRDMLKAKGA